METELWRIWTLSDATTARVFLASSLFRGTSIILSRFTLLGELASLIELLLGAATAVLGVIGVLVCLGRNTCNVDAAPIGEDYGLFDDDRRTRASNPWEEHAEVTVRLEEGYPRLLHGHRCIVTIQDPGKGAREKGQEVWYART